MNNLFNSIDQKFAAIELFSAMNSLYQPIIPQTVRTNYNPYIGKQFGRLTLIGFEYKNWKCIAICNCTCGTINIKIPMQDLLNGKTKSCGCLFKDCLNKRKFIKRKNENQIVTIFDNGKKLEIKCSNNNLTFLVDTITWKYLKNFSWYAHKHRQTYYLTTKCNDKSYEYHKLILSISNKYYVRDHIDRNGLNNLYENLRVVTIRENVYNSSIPSNNKSGIRGVYYDSKAKKWYASLNENMKKDIDVNKGFNNIDDAILFRKELEEKYMQINPINTERLVLSNGELNPNFPYSNYPNFLWINLLSSLEEKEGDYLNGYYFN